MAPGNSSFTNIAGATSSSYTTPAAAVGDNGTQFLCVVTNSQGTTPSNAATLTVFTTATKFITSTSLGTIRNNYTGWIGNEHYRGGIAVHGYFPGSDVCRGQQRHSHCEDRLCRERK